MPRRPTWTDAWWPLVGEPVNPLPPGRYVRAVAVFTILVVACAVLLASTAGLTGERIEQNRNRQFLDLVSTLIGGAPPQTIEWNGDIARLCDGNTLVRGAVQGYAGSVRWLVAADVTGPSPTLRALRITLHQETPGIADFLDLPERGWLAALRGLDAGSLATVDTVTGATVTSRALRASLGAALADLNLADSSQDAECAP
jgi:Na+-translocating ferredoxin:NAD+ oxidoreductase RnfG subunit